MKTIREHRLARGWTEEHLAQQVGLTAADVVVWETGRFRPTPRYHVKLAQAFAVPMDEIALGEPASQEYPTCWTASEFEFPIAYCTVQPSRNRRFWEVTIPECPYCGRRTHTHGVPGYPGPPVLGHKGAHCDPHVPGYERGYDLVLLNSVTGAPDNTPVTDQNPQPEGRNASHRLD
jgi:transcriptional regulator with XRE-family HTH domain